MKEDIKQELLTLKKIPYVNPQTITLLFKKIEKNPLVLRDEKTRDHFCSFFVPYDKDLNEIYLIHHKKANSWIPPGGHIDKKEKPIDAVRREYTEELKETLTTETIKIFNTSSLFITPQRPDCSVHNDLWYVVFVKKHEYTFDEGEAYAAGWFRMEDAVKKVTVPLFQEILKTLPIFLKIR